MAIKVFDTFAGGSNGDDLDTHTPDTDVVGGGWTDNQANGLELTGAGEVKISTDQSASWIDIGITDVKGTLETHNNGDNFWGGLELRRDSAAQGSRDCYQFAYRGAGGGDTVRLFRYDNAAATLLAGSSGFNRADNSPHTLIGTALGNDFELFVDGTSYITHTDTTYPNNEFATLALALDTSGALRSQSVQFEDFGPIQASGSAPLTPFTADGAATVRRQASGAATLTPFTADGAATVRRQASGAATLTPFTADGAATLRRQASGAATLTPFTADGAATLRRQASGSATLTPFTADGDATLGEKTASGAATLTPFTADGAATIRRQASGSATLTPFTADGDAAANAPPTASGAATLTPFTADGVATIRRQASGSATLTPFTADGAATVRRQASGAATLTPFTADGVGRIGGLIVSGEPIIASSRNRPIDARSRHPGIDAIPRNNYLDAA